MLLLLLHTAKGCAGTADAKVTGTWLRSKTKLGAWVKACTGLAVPSRVGSQVMRMPARAVAPPPAAAPPWWWWAAMGWWWWWGGWCGWKPRICCCCCSGDRLGRHASCCCCTTAGGSPRYRGRRMLPWLTLHLVVLLVHLAVWCCG